MWKSQQLHTTEKNKSSNSNQKTRKHPQKTFIFEKIKKPIPQTQNHWFIALFEIKTFKNKTAHDNDRKKYQKRKINNIA